MDNTRSKVCPFIFSAGGCTRPGCWFTHDKSFVSEGITKYAYHQFERYVITTIGTQQFYISWNLILDYLISKNIDIDTFDFTKMEYEGYYDNRNHSTYNRCSFIKIKGIFEKKQFGSNLTITKEVNEPKPSVEIPQLPPSTTTTSPNISTISTQPLQTIMPRVAAVPLVTITGRIDDLAKFSNEMSVDICAIKYKQEDINKRNKEEIESLKKILKQQNTLINEMKSELNKKRNIDDTNYNQDTIQNRWMEDTPFASSKDEYPPLKQSVISNKYDKPQSGARKISWDSDDEHTTHNYGLRSRKK